MNKARRFWPAILAAALIVSAALFVIRIPADAQAVIRGSFGLGPAVALRPGWHLRVPLLQAVHHYPAGELEIRGVEEITSSEGVALHVPYRLSARVDPARLALFDEQARGQGARAFLEQRLQRLLAAGFSDTSAARWTAGSEGPPTESIVGELEALGLTAVSLSLDRPEAPQEAGRASLLAEIRKKSRNPGRKILLIGLDGADWQLIDPWIAQGKLPNLARLKARSSWANLKSMQPILSPLLWTSVATGRRPEEHGIVDFLVKDPATGQKVPISSRFRKVPALWNIFSEMDRTVGVVAWWASYPAEPVHGVIVSDRVAYSLFGYRSDPAGLPGAAYPEDYLASIQDRLVTDAEVTLPEVREFADITAEEFQERRAQIDRAEARKAYADPVNHLTRILASARTYQAAALDLLGRGQPDLMLVYYQGIDEVGHRFMHLMPPKMAMAEPGDYRRFHGAVEAFYRYQDRLLGELLAKADPKSLVIVLSDHGFKNGPGRPTDDPPYIEGKPGKWHRLYGIFMMAGPGVKPGQIDTVSLLDMAPTILAAAGIPPSDQMPGRVLSESFVPQDAKNLMQERVASYDALGNAGQGVAAASSAADQEMIANLRSLGYIGGATEAAPGEMAASSGGGNPQAGGETVTYHTNLATLQLKSKNYDAAQKEIDEALKLVPDFVPALMTQASLFQATQQPDRALGVYRRVLDTGKGESGMASAMADLFVKAGRTQEGIDYFETMRGRLHGGDAVLALAKLWETKGDVARAEGLYREALAAAPGSTEAASRLFEILKKRGEETSLEPVVRAALRQNENSTGHHNLLGLILERRGDPRGAERELRRAVELDPDYAGVLANLGALLARTGRDAEAVAVLTRAVAKEPNNYEARMNLGAALGKSGRHDEAIAQFEEARQRGFRSPTLFNGLAIAYHETGQIQKCIDSLKESLSLDPDQPQVKAMLAEVQGGKS